MSDFVILSSQKPKFNEPCNGCGWCCQNEACALSVELLESVAAPCIALEFDGTAYRCGLVTRPAHYLDGPEYVNEALGLMIAFRLGVGRGCCSC